MITFKDILNQKSWNSYEDYITEGIGLYSAELSKDISEGKKHKQAIRNFIEKNFEIKKIPEDLTSEKNLLVSGNVV